jgi:hypothetical protein
MEQSLKPSTEDGGGALGGEVGAGSAGGSRPGIPTNVAVPSAPEILVRDE